MNAHKMENVVSKGLSGYAHLRVHASRIHSQYTHTNMPTIFSISLKQEKLSQQEQLPKAQSDKYKRRKRVCCKHQKALNEVLKPNCRLSSADHWQSHMSRGMSLGVGTTQIPWVHIQIN